MDRMILGTAGHVDHGKTALVKALTGVDTDRLAEEKRRGITIDLGFAPLDLEGQRVGVVDVPGHEAFVRNMLAGATGVDLALLVIAADEGVMPQTREHLAILSLLGIRGGVVALSKADLADSDWLELVTDDVRAAVADTSLGRSEVVRTSAVTGEGLNELRGALARAASALPRRDAGDLFRLPVDRAFTVKGTGTVVTGTVWSGALERETTVRILPSGRHARVRGIESHGRAVDRALPGTRAAVALAGVDVHDVPRGTTLVRDDGWMPSSLLLAEIALLDDAPSSLGPRTRVRFHLGTADVGARLVAPGGAIARGERRQARVVLDEPVVARAGDRFVLRSASPLHTIGGGIVEDPQPAHRRARPAPKRSTSARERLERALSAGGGAGIARSSLAVRIGAAPDEAASLVKSLGPAVRVIGDRLYLGVLQQELGARLIARVAEYHARNPLEPGAPLQMLRVQLAADSALVDAALAEQQERGTIEVRGAFVATSGWQPTLSMSQVRARDALRSELSKAGREPPSVGDLTGRFGSDTVALLKLLERGGEVVQVEAERYYSTEAMGRLLADLRVGMADGREYAPAELREMLGISRKFLIPFLEYCDRTGVTERRSIGRVLGGKS
ncbi:MAG TPA: selenocysteine-specific translation elongation factor [Gemmatimonadaceae bacterium]|nr:selenocysteine-specific translation elongation factor [Gemmatimonadaceae bacterium]